MTDPLATIRRAYRYIAAYERRVLDAVDAVDEELRELGFERKKPHRWSPLYNSFPSRTYAPEHWVWDNLPNYAMRYQWISGAPNAVGSRWTLLDHVADTAFELRRIAEPGEPNPLEDLAPVEESRSVLRWQTIEFEDSLPEKTYNLSWNKLLETQLGNSISDRRVTTPTASPVVTRTAPLKHAVHCVDIASLTDPDSLRKLFVAPLLGMLVPTSVVHPE